jgi:hypothetical protein
MRQFVWASLLFLSLWPGAVQGQNSILNPFNTLSDRAGIQIHGVSVYSAYYSSGTPFGLNVPFSGPLAENVYAGASASFGWSKRGQQSNATVIYSPSYVRTIRTNDFSTVNHDLTMNWSTKLGAKWAFGASAAAMISNLEQLMFTPTQLSNVASLPASFDELAGAILAGRSTNFQLASMLTSAAALNSPERAFLYGNRMLGTSAQVSLSYAASQRSSITLGLYATRVQRLEPAGASEAAAGFLIPQTTSGGVNLGWSYSLSPRTQVGAEVGTSRVFSRFQEAYITRGGTSIGRIMSRRWFVQARFGAGYLKFVRQTIAVPRTTDYVAGAALGYKTTGHTFLAAYDRTIGDSYGAGAGSTSAISGTWSWRAGRSWSISSSVGHQKLEGSALGAGKSWSASAGLAKSLGSQMYLGLQYGYVQFPAFAISSRGDLSQNGGRVSLTWTPFAHR